MESDSIPSKIQHRRLLTHDKRPGPFSLLETIFVDHFVSVRSPSSENESDGIPQKSSRSKGRQQPISTTFAICSFLFSFTFSLPVCFRKKILPNPSSLLDENTHPFVVDVRPSRERESSGDLQEIYRSTLRDLDFERDRRWRAEQEIKHLNDRLEDFQRSQPTTTTNGNILQELNDKHQQRLEEEKSKFQDLAKIVDDYKVKAKNEHFSIILLSIRNVFEVPKINCPRTRKLRKPIFN